MKPHDNNELKQLIRRIQTGGLHDAWLDDTLMDSIASNTVFTDSLSVFDDYVPEHDRHNKLVKLIKAVCHGVQTGDYHERYLPVLSALPANMIALLAMMNSITSTMDVMNGNAIMHSLKAWFMVADNIDMPVEYVREMLLV